MRRRRKERRPNPEADAAKERVAAEHARVESAYDELNRSHAEHNRRVKAEQEAAAEQAKTLDRLKKYGESKPVEPESDIDDSFIEIKCGDEVCDRKSYHTRREYVACVTGMGGTEAAARNAWDRERAILKRKMRAADKENERYRKAQKAAIADGIKDAHAKITKPRRGADPPGKQTVFTAKPGSLEMVMPKPKTGMEGACIEEETTKSQRAEGIEFLKAAMEQRFRGHEHYYGYTLPGHGLTRSSCLQFYSKGCMNEHRLEGGKAAVERVKMHCSDWGCAACLPYNISKFIFKVGGRMLACAKTLASDIGPYYKQVWFQTFAISPSRNEQVLWKVASNRTKIRKKYARLLMRAGLLGVVLMDHPVAFEDGATDPYWRAHLHGGGIGFMPNKGETDEDRVLGDIVLYGRVFDRQAVLEEIDRVSLKLRTRRGEKKRTLTPGWLVRSGCDKHTITAQSMRDAALPLHPDDAPIIKAVPAFTDMAHLYANLFYVSSHLGIERFNDKNGNSRVRPKARMYGILSNRKLKSSDMLTNDKDISNQFSEIWNEMLKPKTVEGEMTVDRNGKPYRKEATVYELAEVKVQAAPLPAEVDLRTIEFGPAVTMTPGQFEEHIDQGDFRSYGRYARAMGHSEDNPAYPESKLETTTALASKEWHEHTESLVAVFKLTYRAAAAGDCREKYSWHFVKFSPDVKQLCPFCFVKLKPMERKNNDLPLDFDPTIDGPQLVDREGWDYTDRNNYDGLFYFDEAGYAMRETGVNDLTDSFFELAPETRVNILDRREKAAAMYIARQIRAQVENPADRPLLAPMVADIRMWLKTHPLPNKDVDVDVMEDVVKLYMRGDPPTTEDIAEIDAVRENIKNEVFSPRFYDAEQRETICARLDAVHTLIDLGKVCDEMGKRFQGKLQPGHGSSNP